MVATTFGELRFKVGAGDTVFVTGADGAESKATIVELTASMLLVTIDNAPRELTEDGVARIRQLVPDPIGGGAAAGALVGAGTGLLLSRAVEGGSAALGGLIYGGIGALVGMGIDAAVQGDKTTIYERRRAARHLVVTPIAGAGTRGLVVGLRF
jgi:hypothetical protein